MSSLFALEFRTDLNTTPSHPARSPSTPPQGKFNTPL